MSREGRHLMAAGKTTSTASAYSSLQNWRRRISTGMDRVFFLFGWMDHKFQIFPNKICISTQILPGLFVGGLRDAIDVNQLEENKIRAIVSVHGFTKQCDFGGANVQDVLRVVLNDSPSENVLKHFASINTFIHAHRLKEENVLVHCLAGASRSVCFCVAYLMTITNLNYTNALDYMSTRRYCSRPNFGFKMQLMKFGQKYLCAERQRLFGEFASQKLHEQFIQLYRQDCKFTNSLFVMEANETEMHFCCSSLASSFFASFTSSSSSPSSPLHTIDDDAQRKAETAVPMPPTGKEEKEEAVPPIANRKHPTKTAINHEKNGCVGGTQISMPLTPTTTTAKLLEKLHFIDE